MRQSEAKGVIKHLDCVKAFAEGKTIQAKDVYDDWCDESNPCWYPELEYRIKPESKIVPYENMEEFLKASNKHGPYIKFKEGMDEAIFPNIIRNNGITIITYDTIGRKSYTFETLKNYVIWQDGTPCGKIMEE